MFDKVKPIPNRLESPGAPPNDTELHKNEKLMYMHIGMSIWFCYSVGPKGLVLVPSDKVKIGFNDRYMGEMIVDRKIPHMVHMHHASSFACTFVHSLAKRWQWWCACSCMHAALNQLLLQ